MRPVVTPAPPTLPVAIRTLVWVVASAVLGVLALAPAVVVGLWASDLTGGIDAARLGVAAGVWALMAGGTTVALARLLLTERASAKPHELAGGLFGGAVASAAAEGGVIAWMIDHYGQIQSEVAALSYFIAIDLALLTSSVAAVLVTVGAARAVGLSAAVVALMGLVLAAVSNLPGIADGISPSGPALMVSFGASGSYAVLASYLVLRPRRGSAD